MNKHQDDWDKWLSIAEFTYNDQVHTMMQSSPFVLNTRQHPWLGGELLRESHLETLMTLPPEWRRPQTKHIQPSPKQPMTWPDSMMPIVERHHYMRLGIRYGLMVRT